MNKILKINGIEIKKNTKTSINLNIAKLPTLTPVDIPVYIYRGKEDGPVLFLSSSIHGDEINGIEIIRRLKRNNKLFPNKGTVITIPLVNVYGFIHKTRELPDGRDLNRSFPGNASGSLASRIAYILMKEIIPKVDYCIDFHTGGASRANFPQIRCCFKSSKEELDLAKVFAPPYILNSSKIDKSYRKEVSRSGKTILLFEAGESSRFDEEAISEGYDGVLRIMNHLGMSNYDVKEQTSIILSKKSWVRAKYSGVFIPAIKNGQQIKKNDVLGVLTDPFGLREHKVKANSDGYILSVNNMPVTNQGDAIILIGHE